MNEGNRVEKSKKILITLDKIDTELKSDCVINLSKSVSYNLIDSRNYMRLCQLVTNIITEDLFHLKEEIKEGDIAEDEFTDDFLSYGLLRQTERGYTYNKSAHLLVKYGLNYGEDYKFPNAIEGRLTSVNWNE